jgi:hypothetical protein
MPRVNTKPLLPIKPKRSRSHASLYLAKAGHLHVMSQFLLRGYNVAMPEVDIGDDVYVVQVGMGTLWEIQVKTATCVATRSGYRAQLRIRWTQLIEPDDPPLYYVFTLHAKGNWQPSIVLRRAKLLQLHESSSAGTRSGGYVHFTIWKNHKGLHCGKADVTPFADNWGEWPVLEESGSL